MEVIKSIENFNISNSSVAIGKFNGIHKGHVALINEIAGDENPLIFIFDKNVEAGRILDNGEEVTILEEAGIKYLIKCPIDRQLMSMTPEKFVKEILVDKLGVKKVVCGKDFRFGNGRSGDYNKLMELGKVYGFVVVVVDDCIVCGKKVSSSLICEALEQGNIEEVNKLLGREYAVTGCIVSGRRLGRTLDFPTINIIPLEEKLLPPFGVYYTRTEIEGVIYDGVTNIGNNPTVCQGNEITVETHLLGVEEDFYGKTAKVKFYKFARKQQKFESIEKLKEQIKIDADNFSI